MLYEKSRRVNLSVFPMKFSTRKHGAQLNYITCRFRVVAREADAQLSSILEAHKSDCMQLKDDNNRKAPVARCFRRIKLSSAG
jgi:hypothetical protein